MEKREFDGDEVKFVNCMWMRAHGTWWIFSDLDIFKSRGDC